jgi:hypothetical protein
LRSEKFQSFKTELVTFSMSGLKQLHSFVSTILLSSFNRVIDIDVRKSYSSKNKKSLKMFKLALGLNKSGRLQLIAWDPPGYGDSRPPNRTW